MQTQRYINGRPHLHFSFSHHKIRNLFTCSCFFLVPLKEKELKNAVIGVSLCYVKPIFVLLPRVNKLRECCYSPHYCMYYLHRQLFLYQLRHSSHKQGLCKVSKSYRIKRCIKKCSAAIQMPCVPQQDIKKSSSRQY